MTRTRAARGQRVVSIRDEERAGGTSLTCHHLGVEIENLEFDRITSVKWLLQARSVKHPLATPQIRPELLSRRVQTLESLVKMFSAYRRTFPLNLSGRLHPIWILPSRLFRVRLSFQGARSIHAPQVGQVCKPEIRFDLLVSTNFKAEQISQFLELLSRQVAWCHQFESLKRSEF